MKIGILTFHSVVNYGAVLQAYALQSYLMSRGHAVEIIDYRPPYFHEKDPLNFRPDRLAGRLVGAYVASLFEKWRTRFLCRSKPCFSVSDLERYLPRYDAIVIGSDQVWSPDVDRRKETDSVYFCRWPLPPETRKIAYAASFGKGEIQPQYQEAVTEGLKNIDVISVREESGVQIVKALSGREAAWVCDPVFLLSPAQWRSVARVTSRHRKEIFAYMVPSPTILAKLAKSLSVKIASSGWGLRLLFSRHLRMAWLGPFDWIRRIAESRAVLTQSFHGTAFCVLMHTPFIYLMPPGSSASRATRVVSLLSRLGLENHIVCVTDVTPEFVAKKISEPTDWAQVNQRLEKYVQESIAYLKKELR